MRQLVSFSSINARGFIYFDHAASLPSCHPHCISSQLIRVGISTSATSAYPFLAAILYICLSDTVHYKSRIEVKIEQLELQLEVQCSCQTVSVKVILLKVFISRFCRVFECIKLHLFDGVAFKANRKWIREIVMELLMEQLDIRKRRHKLDPRLREYILKKLVKTG